MQFGITVTEGGSFDGYGETELPEQLALAESLGFDSAWVTEHHATTEEYWPAPLLRMSYMAALTDEMTVGSSVSVLPLHHPVESAEKIAVLDQLSGGRVIYGAALGYVESEFEAFGVPFEERAGRLVEGLQLLDRLLSETEVTFDGNHWQLDGWRPNVSPVQSPRPPIWLGGIGDLALRRSVILADAWLPPASMTVPQLEKREATLRNHADERGRDWDAMAHPLPRIVTVAETREEAEDLARNYAYRKFHSEFGEDDGDWSHPLISPEAVRDFDTFVEDRLLVGTPPEVAEEIETLQNRVSVDRVIFRVGYGGVPYDRVKRQIELLGEEVFSAIH